MSTKRYGCSTFSRLSGTIRRKATASMKPAPRARKYWRNARSQRRRAVTRAPPRRSARPATAPSATASSNPDMVLRAPRALPAQAEELEVVPPDADPEVRALQRAAPDVLDPPAALADEVVVVTPEVVGQLVALRAVA